MQAAIWAAFATRGADCVENISFSHLSVPLGRNYYPQLQTSQSGVQSVGAQPEASGLGVSAATEHGAPAHGAAAQRVRSHQSK